MKKIAIYFIVSVIIGGCATAPVKRGEVVRQNTGGEEEELFLGDTAVVSVPDTFLTNIDKNDQREIVLTVPAETKPAEKIFKYDTLQAFAVQLQAFGSESSAQSLVEKLQPEEKDSVFYDKEGSLYKVRVGPYFVRAEADSRKIYYRNKGFRGAWVTPYLYVKRESEEKVQTPPREKTSLTSEKKINEGNVFIQVASAGNPANARNFLLKNPDIKGHKVSIKEVGGMYKLVVGPYPDKESAGQVLPEIKALFPDAWVIEIN